MKKHIIFQLLGVLTLTAAMTSCHDDIVDKTTVDKGTGEAQLASMSIDMSDAEIVMQHTGSRASVDLNDFSVVVKSTTNPAAAPYSWRYGDMPEVITLPVGDYVVEVESHKIQKAEWDRPYYKGSKNFTIESGKIVNIGVVTAKFASLKVTVVFDDEMRKLLGDDVTVTIESNDSGKLVFTPSETRAGFFEVVPNSTTMIAHFEGTVDGTYMKSDTPFTDVQPGQHRIVTYKISTGPSIPEQSGTIDPNDGIIIDTDIETIPIDGNITVEDDILDGSDRPGQEGQPDDPDDPGDDNPGGDKPGETAAATFEATDSPNLSLTGVNVASDNFGNAKVTIRCPKGFKNLVVTIVTDSDDFKVTLEDLNFMPSFDLAYPGEAEENLRNLQLPVGNEVINKTDVLFDITNFVGLLKIYPGNHNFVLSVTDNDNKCETMTLRFKS